MGNYWKSLSLLEKDIIHCCKCPRLVKFRESVPARASFREKAYWRRPVPGFGDPHAWLLILGLAPSAHGGNRTGRIFTGDESGRFLMRSLHKAGFANQPLSESKEDGLILNGCFITPIVKCVPPQNKPLKQECMRCKPYLENELFLLKNIRSVLALGKTAFDSAAQFAKEKQSTNQKISFKHGAIYQFKNLFTLYGSYHPSPQNTYTGKLTTSMLVSLLKRIV